MESTNKITVSDLFIYPIKSCHEINLKESVITDHGLLNDRFLVILSKDKLDFISIRKDPGMYFIKVEIDDFNPNIFTISIPQGENNSDKKFRINISISSDVNQSEIFSIKIWDLPADVTKVKTENDELNQALSSYLGKEVILVKPVTERKIKDYPDTHKLTPFVKSTDRTYFADLAPILVTSVESFNYVDKLVREKNESEGLEMLNFRPNIVLQGGSKAFWENELGRIKIGNVVLRRIKGCDRCKMTTFDLKERKFRKSKEPLVTLNDVSYDDLIEGVIFGQNFCVDLSEDGDNIIKVGDEVELLP